MREDELQEAVRDAFGDPLPEAGFTTRDVVAGGRRRSGRRALGWVAGAATAAAPGRTGGRSSRSPRSQ